MNPLLLIPAWQGLVWMGEGIVRRSKYDAAQAYARQQGKPLLVVGGPQGSPSRAALGMQGHGFGDVCLDLDPAMCQGAPETTVVVGADVRGIPYPDRHFGAAFVSHVLEHLPTAADAWRAIEELRRVADALYVAGPSKQELWAWVHPEHHLWVWQDGSGQMHVEERGR
ncbi:MAG: methyltransferase domain-containing protein [Dehalococcoidales bacterium]|nr:methyltransferase domain-containing protein [Dehalococcoidales bacterium]